jgi:predicted nucleic acid-binding protein
VYRKAIDLALELKLRTLDVMHIAYALELARRGLVEVFATLDGEILERRRLLGSLGLRVQGPVGLDSGARA